MTNTTRVLKAREYFMQGYNCAQAVFAAFADEMGLDEKAALRISSAFGGGMAGMRGVCGAVNGMVMAYSALHGYDTPNDPVAKKALYAAVKDMTTQMTDEYGTLICRELLAQNDTAPSPQTPGMPPERPCMRYVEACASILEQALRKDCRPLV